MERYICIHGHFYQPPRENPWLEVIERQESAYPYHDWNERITAECYLPNAASRILDGEGNISRIVSNYTRMSFNFGPTLLAWMETSDPYTYNLIIEADRESRKRYSGHGSAIAQAYNHMIMPLANQRDRQSQVIWGIHDFERRFGRRTEGMWLPETAVDLETLDIMAEQGIRFTILAPHQAKRSRRTGSSNWEEGGIDTTRAYLVNLPSGRSINVFFYNGPIANAVSFQDVLKDGARFAEMIANAFIVRKGPQLAHIATDGENYGHHHRFGDMALAFAFQHIEENGSARITNYGEYLEKYPPAHEAEVVEKTSWSCSHGIDRWWSDCGDTAGAGIHQDWNQKWRTPLRNAFDRLRDSLSPKYEEKARGLLKDPWAARDGYIDVILDRTEENIGRFFSKYAARELTQEEKTTALKLLEMQRHAMLMYTSCGWYFDELSRPEPVQVMQYAGRTMQLAKELFGDGEEEGFLEIMEQAQSNIPEQGNGRTIYENMVRPAMEAREPRDKEHQKLEDLLAKTLTGMEKEYRPLFEWLYPTERLTAELGGLVPAEYKSAEELVINNALKQAVKKVPPDADGAKELLEDAAEWKITLDDEGIGYELTQTIDKMMADFVAKTRDTGKLGNLLAAVKLAKDMPFPVDLWKTQSMFWNVMGNISAGLKENQEATSAFVSLGGQLNIKVQ